MNLLCLIIIGAMVAGILFIWAWFVCSWFGMCPHCGVLEKVQDHQRWCPRAEYSEELYL